MDPLRYVKFYATIKHANNDYNGLPYTHHLAAVEAVMRKFGITDEVQLQASWLHDVVEDVPGVKVKHVAEMFGDEVAALVEAVTNEPGENRKVRGMKTYPKIRKAGAKAVALKLSDRIANCESGGKLLDMYKNEYEDFKRALYTPGDATTDAMWKHLDELMK